MPYVPSSYTPSAYVYPQKIPPGHPVRMSWDEWYKVLEISRFLAPTPAPTKIPLAGTPGKLRP